MAKLIFQQPLFGSHDPSEIILICWFGAQETFLIRKKSVVLLNILVKTDAFVSGLFDKLRVQKRSIYLK